MMKVSSHLRHESEGVHVQDDVLSHDSELGRLPFGFGFLDVDLENLGFAIGSDLLVGVVGVVAGVLVVLFVQSQHRCGLFAYVVAIWVRLILHIVSHRLPSEQRSEHRTTTIYYSNSSLLLT